MPRKERNESTETFSEQESARRFDTMLRVGLNTPPKLHSEMKLGKGKKRHEAEEGWKAPLAGEGDD
jgi:hypothetical protein